MRLCAFFFLSIFFVSIANAAPTVTGVSGTVTDDQSITISGADFGSTGPNVVLFDDFEGGTNGEDIDIGSGSAKYGQWNAVDGGGSTYYSNDAKVSGSLSFSSNFSGSQYNWLEALLPANTTDIFISWWLYLPATDEFPGETAEDLPYYSPPDGTNWKQMWIQGSDTGDDDLVVPTRLGASDWVINRNESDPNYTNYTTVDFTKGTWKNLMVWIKGGKDSDGELKFYDLTSSGLVQRENVTGVTLLKATGYFERVRVNGWGRSEPDCITSFDDVYIATGANAQARVQIGNNSTYSNCTNLATLTPTSWATTSITATINQGSFADGDAYLFVVDADGVVSDGELITIGDSSTATSTCSGTTPMGN